MIVYSILLITLGIALVALMSIYRARHGTGLVLGILLALFIHLYGGWVFLSFYLKYLFDAAALITLMMALASIGNKRAPSRGRIIANVLLSLLPATLILLLFTGTRPSPPVADLHFPFKAGRYFVLQGGRGLPANFFHGAAAHSIYALDIVKLDSAGRRATQVFSKRLEDYYVFGDTIYSPCAGVVERAIDDNPDNIPPHHVRGPHNLNGVVIAAPAYTVFLGHMQHQRVFVQVGDSVHVGTPLGLAGNSGFTIEPHLHIQVHMQTGDDRPWYRQPPMVITFNGHEYRLFEPIIAQ